MGLSLWAQVEKTVDGVKIDALAQKKLLVHQLVKKDHADSLLGHERTYHYWFPSKKKKKKGCNCQQWFLLPTPLAKFILFIEWLYIYIYIYTHTWVYMNRCILGQTWHFIFKKATSLGEGKTEFQT